MAGFWYPYVDFNEARSCLGAFADASIGPQCGISYSDGTSIAVVRQPSGGGNRSLWLNVLAQHIAAPLPASPPPSGLTGKLKAWFWRAMEIEGEAEIQKSQADLAASQALGQEFHDKVWEPTHEFLLRHKLAADTVGIALDTVGAVAGVVFLVVAAPELVALGTGMAIAGLVTGSAAAAGSFVLLAVDGTIYGAEVSGNEAFASKMEDNSIVQWIRIGATVMLLPDVPVGGLRSLQEIGQLGREATEAGSASAAARESAAEARARVAKISHPERHPGPVNRRLRKVGAFQREAEAQMSALNTANNRIRMVKVRDLSLFQGATLAGTGLMTAAPPGVAMSPEQNSKDEEYKNSLTPKGGMPKDVRLQMRMTGYSSVQNP